MMCGLPKNTYDVLKKFSLCFRPPFYILTLSVLSGIGFLVAVLSFFGHGFSVTVPVLIFGWFWSVELRSILSFGGGADLDSLLVLFWVSLSLWPWVCFWLWRLVLSFYWFRLLVVVVVVSVGFGCSAGC